MPPAAPADRLVQRCEFAAWLLAGIALAATLLLHLLPALLAGLLIYELVNALAPRLRIVRIQQGRRKLAAVALLVMGIVLVLTLVIAGLLTFMRSEAGSVPALLQTMADVL